MLLGAMKKFNGQEVDYGLRVESVKVDEEKAKDPSAYPVTIVTEKDGRQETFEAKFALVYIPTSTRLHHIFLVPLSDLFLGLRWCTQYRSKVPGLQISWRWV